MFFMNITTHPRLCLLLMFWALLTKNFKNFGGFCFFTTCTTFFITCSRFAYLPALCVFTTVDCPGHHFGVGTQC